MGGYKSKAEIKERYKIGNDLSKISAIPADVKTNSANDGKEQRVAVYCRVSTDGISQTTSFEIQKKYYIKYVRNHFGWKLIGVYSDEGISATSIRNRVGLQMLIRDAIDGKIDLIVIKSISRFCRNLADSIQIIKELKSLPKPVGIFFETENMSTLDPAMDLIIKILSMVAEEESKKKSEAITASYRQRYSEGFFNVPEILGYKRVGVNKIEIDEEEAKTVRLIYRMYLAGFSAPEIADTLILLELKKHTFHYLDGTIKEGNAEWSAENVLNVLNNEKRCGDVLAQKTYTYDCIEHIVRKNNRDVPQYYGKDQHEPIISREEYYLALKLKKANKGGWNKGLQIIRAYTSGPMKGFVLSVPEWQGFDFSDYASASLATYGIEINTESIYPYYVSPENCDKSDMPEKENQEEKADKDERNHLYLVSEEEFSVDTILTEEELRIVTQGDINCENEILKLKKQLNNEMVKREKKNCAVSGRLFSTAAKTAMTVDRNGISFNKNCISILGDKATEESFCEIYYNPVREMLIVKPATDKTPNGAKVQWMKNSNMTRCKASGLTKAIYLSNDWNLEYKYKIYGQMKNVNGERILLFDLSDPIIRASLNKKENKSSKNTFENNLLETTLEDVACTSSYYSDNSTSLDSINELFGKVKSRSRAVYFEEDINIGKEEISISDFENQKYKPEFICSMISKGVEPIEGWGYLDGMVKVGKYYIESFAEDWENQFSKTDINLLDEDSEQGNSFIETGWTTQYQFPERYIVQKEIDSMLREKLEE